MLDETGETGEREGNDTFLCFFALRMNEGFY